MMLCRLIRKAPLRAGASLLLAGLAILACQNQSETGPTPPTAPTAPAATPAETNPTTTTGQPATDSAATTKPEAPEAPTISEMPIAPEVQAKLDQTVASSDLGEVTRADLMNAAIDVQVPPMGNFPRSLYPARQAVAALPDAQLTSAARWVVSREVSYNEMQKNGTAETKQRLGQTFEAAQRRSTIMNRVVDQEINYKMPVVTTDTLKRTYQQHMSEYKRPFQFTMRHLVLLTYVPYTVKDGDTLESIAEQINGDPKVADKIREDVAQRPLRREEGKQFKPLAPGERLLVPMNDEDAAKVKARLARILDEQTSGVTFQDLADKYSESAEKGREIGPFPSGTRPILDKFIEEAKATPVGGISPIFRTEHGWQAIQIVQKQQEGVLTLEEARADIESKILKTAQEQLSTALLDRLLQSPQLKLNADLIAKKGDSLSTDTVVATVGDQKLLWNDFREIWDRYKPQDEKSIRELLQRVRAVQEMLLVSDADDDLKNPDSTISKAVARARTLSEGDGYLAVTSLAKAQQTVTTDAMKAYYEQHKDEYFKALPKVTFRTIERRLTQAQRQQSDPRQALIQVYQQIVKDLQSVQTEQDFTTMSAKINAEIGDEKPEPYQSLTPTSDAGLPKPMRNEIERLNEGEWSKEPILIDGYRLIGVLLMTKKIEGYRPFEEVKADVARLLLEENYKKIHDEAVQNYLDQVHFQSKLR